MHEGEYLRKYIKTKPMKVTSVVELTGIQRPTVYTHFNKEKIDSLTKILYTEKIGIIWDEQLLDKPPPIALRQQYEAKPIYQDIIQVPIVEKRAKAGYVVGYADPEYIDSLKKVFVSKQYEKGNYLVFEIEGDSMDDGLKHSVSNGDLVLGNELDRVFWKEKLYYTKYLFIIVTEDGVVCKQIIEHNVETGDIVCRSFNPVYRDFSVNLNDVYQLFFVVKKVEADIVI